MLRPSSSVNFPGDPPSSTAPDMIAYLSLLAGWSGPQCDILNGCPLNHVQSASSLCNPMCHLLSKLFTARRTRLVTYFHSPSVSMDTRSPFLALQSSLPPSHVEPARISRQHESPVNLTADEEDPEGEVPLTRYGIYDGTYVVTQHQIQIFGYFQKDLIVVNLIGNKITMFTGCLGWSNCWCCRSYSQTIQTLVL